MEKILTDATDIINISESLFKKYPKYFENDSNFKYGSCGDFIIVFEKMNDTIVYNNDLNQLDPSYAKYYANKLKVVFIINKFLPEETPKFITHTEFCKIITYDINEICLSKENHALCFYNKVEPAYFSDIKLDNYTGFYMSWFDNGLISEKGHYINGQRHGLWQFGTNTKSTQTFREETYVNGKIYKNNYQLIKLIPNIIYDIHNLLYLDYNKIIYESVSYLMNNLLRTNNFFTN